MNFETVTIEKNRFQISKPDTCYYCEKGIDPKIINKFVYRFYHTCRLIIAYQCPCCDEVFFAIYEISLNSFGGVINRGALYPFRIIGGNKLSREFSQEIKDVSERFISIFNDAFIAEQAGCKEIVGIGYRRAFEFLIKDFAIKYHPDEKDKISNMQLSQCVEKYSPDEDTKQLLLRASWIGNDFAHYTNKHDEITIEDLKQLILLSVESIDSYIKRKNYINKIDKK